jgi:hypothetical protein
MGIIVGFWLVCAICSTILASYKNRSALGWFFVGLLCGPFGLLIALFPRLAAAPSTVPAQDDFEERWATLTQYDAAARSAMGSLEGYGPQAITELKKAYRGSGDPSQLPRIAQHIAREVEESRDEGKLMAKFGITQDPGPYVYRGYRYNNLRDAVNYAKRFVAHVTV